MARQECNDHPVLLVAGAPHDAVAGNQCRQVAAPVAAEYLACLLAIQRFDFNQYAKMGDDQAVLLLAEVAALQFLQGAGLTLGGAGAAFFLDFSMRQLCRRLSWRLAMGVRRLKDARV